MTILTLQKRQRGGSLSTLGNLCDLCYFTIIILVGILYIKWKKYKDMDTFEKMLFLLAMCIIYPYITYQMQICFYSNTYYVGERIHYMFSDFLSNFASGEIDQIYLGQEKLYENELLDAISKIGMFTYLILMFSMTFALGTVVKFFKGLAGVIKRSP